MVTILFFLLLLIEIGLVIFTLAKQKSYREWTRNRLIANGLELALFLCMALLPGIDFSFRFRILLWLIVLRILIAGIRFLIKYRKAEGKKKAVILIPGALFVCIISFLSLAPAYLFPNYQDPKMTGSYEVAMKKAILIDNSRVEEFESDGSKREVPIYIYYPANAGKDDVFPLVLFSHGAFGYFQSNTSTYMELVSNGYVVVSIEHPYHSIFTTDTNGKTIIADRQFLSDAMYIGSTDDLDEIMGETRFAITNAWMKLRIADMNFAVDTIKAACDTKTLAANTWSLGDEAGMLEVLSHIDCGKIGLMGHSMGGATAVAVGHERDDISAVIDIDGTMLGEEIAVENGKYVFNEKPYPIPLLSLNNMEHGTDAEVYGENYANSVVMRNALNAQTTYIRNSGHMNFTDLPLFSPFLSSMLGTGDIDARYCIELVNDIILNFMDSNLKGDGSYRVKEFYE